MLKSILALAFSLTLAGCAKQAAVAPTLPPAPVPHVETPAPAPAAPTQPVTPGFTAHSEDNWSLLLPNDFILQENEDINLVAVSEKSSAMVLVFAANTNMTLAQYVQESVTSIRESGLRLTSLKKVQWLGHDAAAIELLKPSSKGTVKASHWATITDGKVYNLGCIVLQTNVDDSTKMCKAVFDSFKLAPAIKK